MLNGSITCTGARWLAALLASALVLLLSGTALAQTITTGTVTRGNDRDTGALPNQITYNDCAVNDSVRVNLMYANAGGLDLQVWAGESNNCADNEQREEQVSQGRCFLIESLTPVNQVTIPVRAIIPNRNGAADVCEQGTSGSVTLYFMLFDGSNAVASAELDYSWDIKGPAAPELTELGIGEGRLYPHWNASSNSDIVGYYVYCEEAEPVQDPGTGGATASGGAAGDSGAGDAGGGVAGASGSGGTAGASGSGGTAGASGSSGASGSGGAAGATGSSSCTAPTLRPGARPPSSLERGDAGELAEKATADGLKNGVRYACGVAGYDDQGNVGALSNLRCAQPKAVLDYFEAYRQAGGKAGGGLCSFGRNPAGGAGLLLTAAALGLAFRSGRRRGGAR